MATGAMNRKPRTPLLMDGESTGYALSSESRYLGYGLPGAMWERVGYGR